MSGGSEPLSQKWQQIAPNPTLSCLMSLATSQANQPVLGGPGGERMPRSAVGQHLYRTGLYTLG